MSNNEPNLEYELLSNIVDMDEPVGASSLALALETSQATVGRKLHELEFRGYLEKKSNKGRVITEEGKTHLKLLENEAQRQSKVNELINESNITSEKELLDILCARRLIEKEIVYLAAQKITKGECKTLEKILSEQRLEIKYGAFGDQQDLEFHSLIGKISDNKILSQMTNLITTQTHAYLEFSYLSKKFKTSVTDHEAILHCLIKGDPEGAAEAMVQHIDKVIRNVKKYFKKKH